MTKPEIEIAHAAQILRAGGLVAFPTETVYGLGASAENPAALLKIFRVKGRPCDHPLIVHLAQDSNLADFARNVPPVARLLAKHFWPGPLTLILQRGSRIPLEATGGLETVGLRIPQHPLACALLEAFGGAIAAPSANRYGSVSPTTAQHVLSELGHDVDCILDGGPCAVGVESTILDLSQDGPTILRPGGVPHEAIEQVLGLSVPVLTRGSLRVPGQMPSHYAPEARVHIVSPSELVERAAHWVLQGKRVGVIADSVLHTRGLPAGVEVLLVTCDPVEQAQKLYSALRKADELGCEILLASLPGRAGLGLAIADRLTRAAGPRGS